MTKESNDNDTSVKTSSNSPTKSPKSSSKDKRERRREKENKTPSPAVILDWRESSDNNKTPPKPKSKGISPKSFHSIPGRTAGTDNNSNQPRRSRPGDSFVQKVHEQSRKNVLRASKDQLIKEQQIRRSAYKEVTSLKTWPLQDLAFQDYDALLRVYLNQDTADRHGITSTAALKAGGGSILPDHQYGDSSSSCNSTDKKRTMKQKETSPGKSQQKYKYQQVFLEEQRIPAHNVPTLSYDPAEKFDKGLWSMEPRVFSIERQHGKRKYLVGHAGRVMDFIWRKTDRTSRYCYEMIMEKTPCRLYFDLEFATADNPNVPIEELLDEFYHELKAEFRSHFAVQHTEGFDRTCVVDLDSSTPQKFSRHWIIHLPSKALFADSAQAGKFVKRFVQRLADQFATGQLGATRPHLQKFLFINPKGSVKDANGNPEDIPVSEKTCFVDLGVYTRNRLFRLLGSSKYGKSPDCALHIADANKFPFPHGFSNDRFYLPAMTQSQTQTQTQTHSDNSNGGDNEDDSEGYNSVEKLKALTDWSAHAEALCQTLVVPLNGPKIDYLILPEIVDESGNGGGTKTTSEYFSSSKTGVTQTPLPKTYTFSSSGHSFGASPFPYIDDFVSKELANRGGVQGSIRSWSLDYGPDDSKNKGVPVGIAYSMCRNRWCECVGRFHKSNNILWNVSFQTKQCVQSCYDPDCRRSNFRGTPVDLPLDVAEKLGDALFEAAIGQMDDDELLAQSDKATAGEVLSEKNGRDIGFNSPDDAELEEAMMALKVDSDSGKVESSINTDKTENKAIKSTVAEDELSDDVLMDAISENPEIFD